MRADLGDEFYEPEMPEVVGGDWLIDHLWDAGPVIMNGMGSGPLTHNEILCWQMNTGIRLGAWEARTLRRLSQEYLDQCQESRSPSCPSPIAARVMTEDARQRVSDQVQSGFRALMQKGKKK